MINKELFTLNPEQVNLKNEGVAKIRTINETEDLSVAEYELQTFVCEGEYHDGLRKILEFYLNNYNSAEQPGFWVSGFYGSGKSHLVKMAGYLWSNFEFPGGKTARSLKKLPQDIHDLLVELDRKQAVQGKLAIAGTLRDFPSRDIRYSFLQIFLNSLGLPRQYHHFKFVHWARREGIYDNLKALVEGAGKNFQREVENLFVSPVLAKSVLQLLPDLAENEMKLKDLFKAQFPRVETIGREEFIQTIREEVLPLSFGDKIPCTIIILDEVQQFIGQDANLAFDVQLLAEDLCSRFDGKFLLIGTGQNALTDTPTLQRLMARFRVAIQLSSSDIQTVIRKTILDKKASAVKPIEEKLNGSLGEIARNLEGTAFGYLTEDRHTLTADYPLLPSTRKFWQKVLQVIDVAGTSGQLRNQLRIIDDSLKLIANRELGQVVPADYIFDQNQTQLIQAGLLLNDTHTLIAERKAKGGDTALEGRILSAVFLLDQVSSNIPDTGLKSNETRIADLLLSDVNTNSEAFRTKVKELVKKLVDEKVLMTIGDEYKLQTKVGAEWEQEYTKQHIKLNNSGEDQIIQHRRERMLAFVKERTRGIAVNQGNSRTNREFELWDKETPPSTEHRLHIWLRDGWLENESSVLDEIRAAGNHAPLAYVFVKKFRDPELRQEIIRFLASKLTIEAMGLPATPEAEQARKSMETRQRLAKDAIQELIEKIGDAATVYLAGGAVESGGTLKDNIQKALQNIAVRQFSDFGKADALGWEQAFNKASAGDPDALKAIGYNGDVDKHPVGAEMLRFIGNGSKSGKDIRNQFLKAPYGWSQDAIDTMLVLLKNAQVISCTEKDLRRNNLSAATFKTEVHILGAKDKIALRKLLQTAGINCAPNQELFSCSGELLEKLRTLAGKMSGDAPRPEPVSLDFIKDLESRDGNDRLLEMLRSKDQLEQTFKEWTAAAALVADREPNWRILAELVGHAPPGSDLEQLEREVDAIRNDRLLLHSTDKVEPLLQQFAAGLQTMLNERKSAFCILYDEQMDRLQHNPYFEKLTPEQKHAILLKNQILVKPEIKSYDAPGLLLQLQKVSLDTWETRLAALPGQFAAALEEAILLSAPKAKTYSMPRCTLSSEAEIEAYLEELKNELKTLLQNAPSVILK